MAVIYGTTDSDYLAGTDGDDELYGLESDDLLWGGAGADVLDGGEGFDTVHYYGGESLPIHVDFSDGSVSVSGGEAEGDTLISVEKVIGTYGDDTFVSSVGGVTMAGEAGDDLYIVDSEGVTIIEDDWGGYDEIRTTVNNVQLDAFVEKLVFTGTGDFTAYGNDADNMIVGGAGNDQLFGGAGADRFIGGEGFDTVSYSDSAEGVILDLTNGQATGIAQGDTFEGIEALQGSTLDDLFIVDQMSLNLDGGDGFDTVDFFAASQGIDYRNGVVVSGVDPGAQSYSLLNVEKIVGTSSNDSFTSDMAGITLEGRAGDDVYTVNAADVTIIEEDSGGIDELYTNQSSMVMAAFIEKLTYTGTQDFIAFGNDSDNVITGGAGNDVLLGGAGRDEFYGGAGTDIVSYDDSDAGVNIYMPWGGSGIASGDSYYDIEGVRGSRFNDSLDGDSADNILEGGAGNDQIRGGEGADHIYGGLASGLDGAQAQDDYLSGNEGDDVIVTAGNDRFSIANGDEGNDIITVNMGSAAGGDGNDILIGTGTNYHLSGNAGDDVLILNQIGQPGAGFAVGGQGDDTYVVNSSGLVTIQDLGTSLNDTVILNLIASVDQLNVTRIGNDAYLHSANDGSAGVPTSGVKLQNWYAGQNDIEHIQTADGQVYDLPTTGDAFAMFG